MLNGVSAEEADPPPPRVLFAVTSFLERLVSRNDKLVSEDQDHHQQQQQQQIGYNSSPPVPAALEAFRASRPPTISIEKYLGRINKYTGCSPSCFVAAFAYMDRLLHRYPGTVVVSLNVHRLVLAGVLVASKVLDDVHHDNAFYARVGGVSNAELNRLELELLFRLDFGVMVSSRVFDSYCLQLEKEMAWRDAMRKIDRPLATTIDDGKDNALQQSPISSPLH